MCNPHANDIFTHVVSDQRTVVDITSSRIDYKGAERRVTQNMIARARPQRSVVRNTLNRYVC